MESESVKNKLIDVSLGIFLFTIFSYIASVAYQTGVLSRYGIDTSLVNYKIDSTDTVIKGLIFLIVVFVFTLFVALINNAEKKNTRQTKHNEPRKIKTFITGTSVMLMIGLVITAISKFYPSILGEELIKAPWQGFAVASIFLIIPMIDASIIGYKKKKYQYDLQKAITEYSVWYETDEQRTKREQKDDSKGKQVVTFRELNRRTGLIYTSLIILVIGILPFSIGANIADNKEKYTSPSQPASSENTVKLIVGQYSSGYILKTYDLKKKKFLDGYELTSKIDGTYKTVEIEPINPTKNRTP